jgi:hypothetical protein
VLYKNAIVQQSSSHDGTYIHSKGAVFLGQVLTLCLQLRYHLLRKLIWKANQNSPRLRPCNDLYRSFHGDSQPPVPPGAVPEAYCFLSRSSAISPVEFNRKQN